MGSGPDGGSGPWPGTVGLAGIGRGRSLVFAVAKVDWGGFGGGMLKGLMERPVDAGGLLPMRMANVKAFVMLPFG